MPLGGATTCHAAFSTAALALHVMSVDASTPSVSRAHENIGAVVSTVKPSDTAVVDRPRLLLTRHEV